MWIYEPTKVFCDILDLHALFINVPERAIFVWPLGCSAAFRQLKRSVILRKNGEEYECLPQVSLLCKNQPGTRYEIQMTYH
jgi:hypothetical protein